MILGPVSDRATVVRPSGWRFPDAVSGRDQVIISMTDLFNRLGWLQSLEPGLADAYRAAHDTAFDAPSASYVALRGFAERFLGHTLIQVGTPGRDSLYERIESARRQRLMPDDVLDGLDALRRDGNTAAHSALIDRKPEHPLADALRLAWTCATWLHRRHGGRDEEVPTFQAPSLADSAAVFRDAMLGGYMGGGDPRAKFHVAQALIEHDDRMRLKARTEGRGSSLNRRPEATTLLRDARHFVPAARALLARLLLEPPNPSATDIAEAIDELVIGCEDDDPAALFELGAIHFHGLHGQPTDLEAARKLFERAVVHEHPGALHALSVIHVNATEPSSQEEARAFGRRAAEAGDQFGQTSYGCMLIEGLGGEVDRVAGATWLRRAAREDWPQAVWWLSEYIRNGRVTPQDGEDADGLLARACELGCLDALLQRAEIALQSQDASADFAGALDDLTSALEYAVLTEHRDEVNGRLQDGLRRLRSHVKALAADSDRRRELCSILVHFRSDGSPRPRQELGSLLGEVAKETAGDDIKASFEAWTLIFQGQLGVPDPTIFDVERLRARTAARMNDLRTVARRVGRNDLCPCGSRRKAKRCHGR